MSVKQFIDTHSIKSIDAHSVKFSGGARPKSRQKFYEENFRACNELVGSEAPQTAVNELEQGFWKLVTEYFMQKKDEESVENPLDLLPEEYAGIAIKDLHILHNVETAETLVYNEARNVIQNLDLKRMYEVFFRGMKENVQNSVKSVLEIDCFFEFNPYSLERFYQKIPKIGTLPAMHFNLYNPPPWRKLSVLPEYRGGTAERILKWVALMIPNEEHRAFFYHWLRNVLVVGRNDTFLIMEAGKGIGKNLFSKLLINLVGPEYHKPIKESMFDGRFNAELEGCVLAVFDEFTSTKQGYNNIKRLSNDVIAVEDKFKSVKTILNRTSFMAFTNDALEIYADPIDERRLSIIEGWTPLFGKRLGDILGSKEMEYVISLGDSEPSVEVMRDIIAFGEWLMDDARNLPKYGISHPIITQRLIEVQENCLPPWQKYLVGLLGHGTEKVKSKNNWERVGLTGAELRTAIQSHLKNVTGVLNARGETKTHVPYGPKLRTFIESYLFQKKRPLAHIVAEDENDVNFKVYPFDWTPEDAESEQEISEPVKETPRPKVDNKKRLAKMNKDFNKQEEINPLEVL